MAHCEAHPSQRATEVQKRTVFNYPKGARSPIKQTRVVHCCKQCTGRGATGASDAQNKQLTAMIASFEARLLAIEGQKRRRGSKAAAAAAVEGDEPAEEPAEEE